MESPEPEDRDPALERRRVAGRGPGTLALVVLLALAGLWFVTRDPRPGTPAPADGGAPPGPERPLNVLFILTDQLNPRATGLYGNGFGGVQHPLTPTLDRLAAQGARFDAALCSTPQCSPSRYTLFTGQWPHTHGLRWNRVWEPLGPVTIASLARDAGYETAHIGKHHMMWLDQPKSDVDLGFSHIVDRGNYKAYCESQGREHHAASSNIWRMPTMEGRLVYTGYTFNANALHPSGFFADQVIDFLDARAGVEGDGKPFLCWYATPGPHTPLLPSGPADPHDWAHRYHPFEDLELPPNFDKEATTVRLSIQQEVTASIQKEEWREVLSYYYGLISQIDYNVGRILQRLEELDLADSTLVIFTADHGEMGSEMGCWSKGTGSYDAINRVPLVMRLPGRVPAGKVVPQPTTNVDLVPTILELTGIPVPESVAARIEGRSLAGLLLDPTPPEWPEGAFSEFGSGVTRHRMVRTAVDKYSFDERGRKAGQEEYYDLVADSYEIHNRIDDPDPAVQARIAHLRGLLADWWQDGEGQAPLYEVAGEADAVPVEASPLAPRDGARNVRRDAQLEWLPCTASEHQRVYFGESSEPPLFRELVTMEASCNLGPLKADTTYYWRVEGVNDNGSHPGKLASFQTGRDGEVGPGLATSPGPRHRARGVARGTVLSWTAASGALSQRLFVGRDGDLEPVADLAPGQGSHEVALESGVAYRWRIDASDASGTTRGDEWTFETDPAGLPGWATGPSPAHLSDLGTGPAPQRLSWQAASGARHYEVYFGSSHPLPRVASGAQTSWELPELEAGRTYYWRVGAVNEAGARRGWNWRFRY